MALYKYAYHYYYYYYRSASFVVVCVYRPPGTVISAFTEQLSDFLDRLATLDYRFVVAGDFNATGDSNAWTVALLTSSHGTLYASMSDLRRTVTATCWT